MKTNIEIMKQILDIHAVSSNEKRVKEFLRSQIKADEIIEDKLGGITFKFIGNKPGNNVLVLAHMDEVGFMVNSITPRGIIKVTNIGSSLPEVTLSQRVVLETFEGEFFEGVILGKSPHGNKSSTFTVEDLELDFGFTSKENAIESGIEKGNLITYKNDFIKMKNDRIATKAADNRLGCLALIDIANKISDRNFNGTIYLGASVQEEVGLRGASPLVYANDVDFDNALIIDVSPVQDTTNVDNAELGKGTLIRVKDPRCILDYDETIVLRKIAKSNKIMAQEFFSKGGTDAAQVQVTKSGIKTVALCVPARNLHSNNTIFDLKDYESTVELAWSYIRGKINE